MKKTARTTKNKMPKTPSKKALPKTNAKRKESKKTERKTLVRTAVAHIGKLFTTEDTNVAVVRFDIGEQVGRLMNAEDAHGKGLVAEVAKELGRDADTLYDYARVGALWTRTGFRKLVARKNDAGATLSFSHFVELAKKGGKNGKALEQAQWMPLFEKALKEKLSVHVLRELVRKALGGELGATLEPPAVHKLAKVTGNICEKTSALTELVAELEKKGIEVADAAQLSLTIEQVEKTGAECAGLLARLRSVRTNVETPRAAAE